MKNQAIVVRKYGGPSVLKLENTEIDEPERNEILLRQIGIGVNYHDIYVRSGLYKTLDLPGIPGCEGVGIIEKKGSQVDHFEIGDKVVYIDKQYGSYSKYKLIAQELAIKVPKNIKSDLVAQNYIDDFIDRSKTARTLMEGVYDIRYGSKPKQTLDLHLPKDSSNTPLLIYIHGGYWRAIDKNDHSFIALPFIKNGIAVANVNYDLCP